MRHSLNLNYYLLNCSLPSSNLKSFYELLLLRSFLHPPPERSSGEITFNYYAVDPSIRNNSLEVKQMPHLQLSVWCKADASPITYKTKHSVPSRANEPNLHAALLLLILRYESSCWRFIICTRILNGSNLVLEARKSEELRVFFSHVFLKI